MDEFKRQLKSDAGKIEADVSPDLRKRIEASLRAAEPVAAAESPARPRFSMWWISGLTGIACALLVLLFLDRAEPLPGPLPASASVVSTVPEPLPGDQVVFPLRAEAAEFTEPLEDELEKLQSDLEKARQAVEADLRGGI